MSWNYPPEICQWDITRKCNLKCLHCRATDSWKANSDLRLPVVLKILGQLISFASDVHFAFAGGEPLMRQDLREILYWIKKTSNTTKTELLSNGTLIDRNNISWLKETVDGFNISLEGANREVNDAVRGNSSFKRAIKGISFLTKEDLTVCVRMTFFHQNEKEVEALMRLLPEIGVEFFNFRYVVPVGRAKGIKVSAIQYQRLCETIRVLGKELNLQIGFSDPFPELLLDEIRQKETREDEGLRTGRAVTGCSMGFSLLYLDPQGIVRTCPYFPIKCADAKKEPLKEIWFNNEMLNNIRRIRGALKGKCGGCEYKFACGGCRGAALAKGNFLGEDPRCWKYKA